MSTARVKKTSFAHIRAKHDEKLVKMALIPTLETNGFNHPEVDNDGAKMAI